MRLDAELMFECLIYLNAYYFPVFATCQSVMTVAKYKSVVDTPDIDIDAAVTFTCLSIEILKIVIYKKFKDDKRDLTTAFASLLTIGTMLCLTYILIFQHPKLKLEIILCVLMALLAVTEVAFGILQIMPCFKKVQYY